MRERFILFAVRGCRQGFITSSPCGGARLLAALVLTGQLVLRDCQPTGGPAIVPCARGATQRAATAARSVPRRGTHSAGRRCCLLLGFPSVLRLPSPRLHDLNGRQQSQSLPGRQRSHTSVAAFSHGERGRGLMKRVLIEDVITVIFRLMNTGLHCCLLLHWKVSWCSVLTGKCRGAQCSPESVVVLSAHRKVSWCSVLTGKCCGEQNAVMHTLT